MPGRIAAFAIAGAAGALIRLALSAWIQRQTPGVFPLATLIVNMTGCLLFGILWSLAEVRHLISPEWRAILLTGFLGAFTTFSAFAYENTQLLRNGHLGWLALNMTVQNVFGVAFTWIGMQIGRLGAP